VPPDVGMASPLEYFVKNNVDEFAIKYHPPLNVDESWGS